MGSSVYSITFDAHDPRTLAAFWEQVLGYERTFESEEENYEVVISPKDGKGK